MRGNSIHEVLEEYLAHLRGRNLNGKTLLRKRNSIVDFLFANRIIYPEDILPDHVRGFQESIPDSGFGNSTQRINLANVREFLDYLREQGLILFDPSALIRLPKIEKPLPRTVLTQEDVRNLLQIGILEADLRLRAVVEILYGTGIRRGELLNLDLYDLDIQKRILFVREGKGGKDRILPVPRTTTTYLRDYIRKTSRRRKDGALFVGDMGRRIAPRQLEKAIRSLEEAALREAGIRKHITCHVFRHSIATHLLENGVDIRYVQAFLGHEKLETTQIYTRVEVSHLARELQRAHPREKMKIPLH